MEGTTVTVTGTATDVGGVIGGVQVSADGGKTWHPATAQIGTQSVNWTYSFNAPSPGTYSIESRAVDDSLNIETPASGTSYVVAPSSALSLVLSQRYSGNLQCGRLVGGGRRQIRISQKWPNHGHTLL